MKNYAMHYGMQLRKYYKGMKTMLKAVIFDMDGVIIDSEPMHRLVNEGLYKGLGFSVTDEEYGGFVGISSILMWKALKEKHQLKQSVQELCELQAKGVVDYFGEAVQKPIEGVVELMDCFIDNGIFLGLASSSNPELINLVLSKLGIIDKFSCVISGNNVKKGKPEPDIFLEAASKLKVEPQSCLVIEDSTNGTKAAKAAGMKCIGYRNLNSGNQDLSLADFIVDSFRQLDMEAVKTLYEL